MTPYRPPNYYPFSVRLIMEFTFSPSRKSKKKTRRRSASSIPAETPVRQYDYFYALICVFIELTFQLKEGELSVSKVDVVWDNKTNLRLYHPSYKKTRCNN
jgi:hypothetical protein